MNILLTGGTGYIGSHIALVLANEKHNVVLYDDLSNSQRQVNDYLKIITNKTFPFINGDVRDTPKLLKSLIDFNIDAVIHLAGKKSVDESLKDPVQYYDNNINGAISLLKAMQKARVKTLVFSSSATVYGNPQYLPVDENHPKTPTNPYGNTKLQIENILYELSKLESDLNIVCLRYFNPVGAHHSSLIGENPIGTPNNLMPYITQVGIGKFKYLKIFGNTYNTVDGTGIRDYIHVMDIAEGHLAALSYILHKKGWDAINLGSGRGFSVLEVVKAFEFVSNKKIPFKIKEPRSGDIAISYADVKKANQKLNWKAKRSLNNMCKSAWNFQLQR